MSYLKVNDYILTEEYIDDGYSGTNFDRPGFRKLVEDINDKKINMVIVKDLSRLGRDHVMTGYYIETFFPENDVRFISIMENYDSAKRQASNDSSTFIVACNDYYSKQNSYKIRDVLHSKKVAGEFIGSKPSYGYMRDPNDKGHLIPDLKVCDNVRNIFKWFSEVLNLKEIADKLNNLGIETPSTYKSTSRRIEKWNYDTVKSILQNRIYTKRLLENLFICKECGNSLTINYRKPKDCWSINCNRFTRYSVNNRCVSHHMLYNPLEELILNKVRSTLDKLRNELDIESLADEVYKRLNNESNNNFKELDKLIEKREKCHKKLVIMYNDKLENKIETYTYELLKESVEKEIAELNTKIEKLENIKKQKVVYNTKLPEVVDKIKELLDLNHPTRELLLDVIDKIVIDKDRNIEIFYKFGIAKNDKLKSSN